MKRLLSVLTLALAAVGANAQTVDTTPYRLDLSPGSYIKRFSHSAWDSSRVASATNRLGQAMIASTSLDGPYAGEVEFYRVDASGNAYYTGQTSSTEYRFLATFSGCIEKVC